MGHEVQRLGREGGDAGDAGAALIAYPINQGGMGPFFYRMAPPDQS